MPLWIMTKSKLRKVQIKGANLNLACSPVGLVDPKDKMSTKFKLKVKRVKPIADCRSWSMRSSAMTKITR